MRYAIRNGSRDLLKLVISEVICITHLDNSVNDIWIDFLVEQECLLDYRIVQPEQKRIVIIFLLSGKDLLHDFVRELYVSGLALVIKPCPIFGNLVYRVVRYSNGSRRQLSPSSLKIRRYANPTLALAAGESVLINAMTLSGVIRRGSAEMRRNFHRRVTSDRDV